VPRSERDPRRRAPATSVTTRTGPRVRSS
jgi:hypothetical protein